MDKARWFRHDRTDQAQDVAAGGGWHQRESRTISMAFVDSLNADSISAESAPWLGKDRC
jgi:hypothetical protein